jgi:hypothetical protein
MQIDWIDFAVTPIVAALVGFGVWYFQSRIERLRREQEKLHDVRRKVYAELLDPYIRMFSSVKDPQARARVVKQITSYDYKKTAFEFSLLGSDKVVRAFNKMMQYFYALEETGQQPDSRTMLTLWGGFLLEIRKSLTHGRTRLTERDMLRGLIKGVDEVVK